MSSQSSQSSSTCLASRAHRVESCRVEPSGIWAEMSGSFEMVYNDVLLVKSELGQILSFASSVAEM